MSGEKRRENLLKILQESTNPVSGTELAEKFNVSRQIVVQDIALLRAKNHEIISTHKGYILNDEETFKRVFKVKHTTEQIPDELNLIVDLGGVVDDVFVYHKVYGVIKVDMNIKSRRDVKKYIEGIESGVSTPLMQITSEYHYHTVSADSKETLDDTLSLLKHDDLQKAVALLQKANIIHLSAISYSLLLGQTFQLNMNRLGKMVHICPIIGEELFMDNLIHEDDCLLMISYSGQIDSMIHLARLAKRKGVSIIVITSLGDNDLRKYGDVVLNISTREKLYSKIGGFVNENSIKLILDILYACYFELNYDDNLNKRINISKESETTRFSSLDIMKESES